MSIQRDTIDEVLRVGGELVDLCHGQGRPGITAEIGPQPTLNDERRRKAIELRVLLAELSDSVVSGD